jgi:hypothetical protein
VTRYEDIALAVTLVVLALDIFYTRKWIKITQAAMKEHRRAARALGYAEDEREDPNE